MELLTELSTAAALAATAGLRAYIPLLIVGVLARFTDLMASRPPFDWLASWWVLAFLAVFNSVLALVLPVLSAILIIVFIVVAFFLARKLLWLFGMRQNRGQNRARRRDALVCL